MARNPPNRHRLVGCLTWIAALTATAPAHADPQPSNCPITVIPSSAAEWRAFADASQAQSAGFADDCAYIGVTVFQGKGHVVYITRDGRHAERDLLLASELPATIIALRTLEMAVLDGAAKVESPKPHDGRGGSQVDFSRRGVPSGSSERIALELGIGLRSNLELASPLLNLAARLSLSRWTLGVLGRFEANYGALRGTRRGAGASAVAFGVSAGRLTPISRALRLNIAGDVIFAAVHEEGSGSMAGGGQAEGRLGLRLGLAYPSQVYARATLQVAGEYNVTSATRSSVEASLGSLVLPTWAILLMGGVEFGAP